MKLTGDDVRTGGTVNVIPEHRVLLSRPWTDRSSDVEEDKPGQLQDKESTRRKWVVKFARLKKEPTNDFTCMNLTRFPLLMLFSCLFLKHTHLLLKNDVVMY